MLKACNTIASIIHCSQAIRGVDLVVILKPPAALDLSIQSEDLSAYTAVITWTNPPLTDRNTPDFYLLESRTSPEGEFVVIDEEIPVGESGGYPLTKLFPGYQNFFRIVGTNLAGTGEPSNERNVTFPSGVPRIREVSTVFLTSSSLNVTYQLWHDGGEPLIGLVVQYRVNTSNDWMTVTDSFLNKNITYFAVISDLTSLMYYDVS